jgi:hypothetical protein
MIIGIMVFCILATFLLSADNHRLKEELKYDREHPDE